MNWLPEFPASISQFIETRSKVVELRGERRDQDVEGRWGDIKAHVFKTVVHFALNPENAQHQQLRQVLDAETDALMDEILRTTPVDSEEIGDGEVRYVALATAMAGNQELMFTLGGAVLAKAIEIPDLPLPLPEDDPDSA